jgi:hypothetical protein
MRIKSLWSIITLLMSVSVLIIGCNDGILSNPLSPPAATTEWRSLSADSTGAQFDFPDIGALVTIPPLAIPDGVSADFKIRLFPPGVPMVPDGPVLIRLGTFEMTGPPDFEFDIPVEVQFRIATHQTPGVGTPCYVLDDTNQWGFDQKAQIMNDGMHVVMHIMSPGIYGSFGLVPLHVEATVSSQMGQAPLSVAFKAVVTGGHPPYDIVWIFGDDTDNLAGEAASHYYKEPGIYHPSIMVIDDDGVIVTDTLIITALNKSGAPNIP